MRIIRAKPIRDQPRDVVRHRLSRAGNRQLNCCLHVMAITQVRQDTPGRAYYLRKRSEGKSHNQAMRCLKRRLSDLVYRRLIHDADKRKAGAVGHSAVLSSRAAGPTPRTNHPYCLSAELTPRIPGPAAHNPERPPLRARPADAAPHNVFPHSWQTAGRPCGVSRHQWRPVTGAQQRGRERKDRRLLRVHMAAEVRDIGPDGLLDVLPRHDRAVDNIVEGMNQGRLRFPSVGVLLR